MAAGSREAAGCKDIQFAEEKWHFIDSLLVLEVSAGWGKDKE